MTPGALAAALAQIVPAAFFALVCLCVLAFAIGEAMFARRAGARSAGAIPGRTEPRLATGGPG